MRMHAVLVLAILSLTAWVDARAADEEAVKQELQALKGTWRLVSREADGQKATDEELKDVIATRDEAGTVSVRRGDQVIYEATGKVDPTKKPKTVDVTYTAGPNKGKVILGIYENEGDTHRVCIAQSGGARPTEFTAKAGSGQTLVVYKREKK